MIVFCNAKQACDALSRKLNEQGYRSTVMHGDRSQDQRMEALGGYDVDVHVNVDGDGDGDREGRQDQDKVFSCFGQ